MSDPIAATKSADQPTPTIVGATIDPPLHVHRSWKIALLVAVAMILLALLGVGLTTAKSDAASVYWVSLVPLYGILCIWTAWAKRTQSGPPCMSDVYRQGFHWLGIGIALGLDFFIRRTGEESGMGAGMVALLLLALGCYLAGIHFEWLFILVGGLLTLTLIVVAEAEEYLWLIFVVGLLSILLLFGLTWVSRLGRSRKEAASPAGS